MTWNYAYTPVIWPSLCMVFLLLFLAGYSWRRRSVPGALPFTIYCLFGVPLLACKIIAYLAVDFEAKVFWFKVENFWWLPSLTAMTCFVLEYAWPGRWTTRRYLALLCIAPLASLVLLLTSGYHSLLFRDFGFNGSVVPKYGPVGIFFVIYTIALTILSFIVFGWLFIRSPQHRWPVTLILIAQLLARGLTMEDSLIRDSWFLYLPEMGFTVVACAIALFGFRIFDPIPMAHQTAIQQLHVGVLVLDSQGCVVSLNPAAQTILGLAGKHANASRWRGRPIREFLPAFNPEVAKSEIILGMGPGTRCYEMEASSFNDWRGLPVGSLLLLRDVTDQKHAQTQIVEQQRALAALQERERLARELHDSLGQTLAAAHFQASSAKRLLDQGQTAQMTDCLEQMANITITAETDVREYLLGAKIGFSIDTAFFTALRQYLARFSHLYGLPVGLSIPEQIEARGLPPEVEVQVLRIIQEALSNARKHGQAKSAQVTFTVQDETVRVSIADDGLGFDPARAANQAEGFGLQSMRERAEVLGGRLEIISQPGQGTQVVVEIPVEDDTEVEAHTYRVKTVRAGKKGRGRGSREIGRERHEGASG